MWIQEGIVNEPAAQRARGVLAYSSGNHAQGTALAAQLLGIPAVIVLAIKISPPEPAASQDAPPFLFQIASSGLYAALTGLAVVQPFCTASDRNPWIKNLPGIDMRIVFGSEESAILTRIEFRSAVFSPLSSSTTWAAIEHAPGA